MSDKPIQGDLSEHLEQGLKQAVEAYAQFIQSEVPTDAKGFIAYHNGCKSVLTHIALLLKLIQGGSFEKSDQITPTDWIKMAKETLEKENDENDMLID